MIEENWSLKVPIPRNHLINTHFNRRFGRSEAIKTAASLGQRSRYRSGGEYGGKGGNGQNTYSAIWLVETLIPLHSSIMRPVNATVTRNLVRVKTTRTALHGGKRALADFHVTPPLGRSILSGFVIRKETDEEERGAATSATRALRRLRQSGGCRTSVSVRED
jgi:hypothetical protein